jgi:hypothetical protein
VLLLPLLPLVLPLVLLRLLRTHTCTSRHGLNGRWLMLLQQLALLWRLRRLQKHRGCDRANIRS